MRRLWAALLVALGVIVCSASAGRAQDVSAGLYAHDVPFFGHRVHEGGEEIVISAGSHGLSALSLLGKPSVYVSGGVNAQGKTDFAAAGLRWKVDLSKKLYVKAAAGLAVNDTPHHAEPGRIWSTSNLTFAPEGAIGVKLTRRVAIEASYIHMSNARIFSKVNPGLNEIGVRAVVRFGGGSAARRLASAF